MLGLWSYWSILRNLVIKSFFFFSNSLNFLESFYDNFGFDPDDSLILCLPKECSSLSGLLPWLFIFFLFSKGSTKTLGSSIILAWILWIAPYDFCFTFSEAFLTNSKTDMLEVGLFLWDSSWLFLARYGWCFIILLNVTWEYHLVLTTSMTPFIGVLQNGQIGWASSCW